MTNKFFIITDPCYIVEDGEWGKFLDVTDYGDDLGEPFKINGGEIIECSPTDGGDGYVVINKVRVTVDAGMVCIAQFDEKPKGRNLVTQDFATALKWFRKAKKI
jgi:hypothetical protein